MAIPDLAGVRVLVTGGGGFIGSHLVDSLVQHGARVRVLDNFSTGHRRNLSQVERAVDLIEGDIRDLEACRKACGGVRVVFHQAALGSVPRSMKDPATTIDVNVRGTANVFAACRDAGVARVVYASSSSVYGDSQTLPKREGEEGRPLSSYALSKVMNEQLAEVFGRVFPEGPSFIGLRYFNVFGPRQDPEGPYAAVVPRFFAAVRSGQPPIVYGDGQQSRDFTFVSDVIRANLLAAGAPEEATGRAYNVAPGLGATVNQLAAAVLTTCGGGPAPIHQPSRAGDILHSRADATRAELALGFVVEVSLETGLLSLCTPEAWPDVPSRKP